MTHIPVDIGKLSAKRFPQRKEMTKNDFVIICGDFGGVWDGSNEEKYWIKWLKSKNFTTLFVDDNHENFDMLYNLTTVEFGGSFAHKVDETFTAVFEMLNRNMTIHKIDKWFGNKSWFKKLWKTRLDKMVFQLKNKGVEDTPYDDNQAQAFLEIK